MKINKIIAHTKRNYNLFTLDLAIFGQIMSAISKVITIISQSQPTYCVSINKRICLEYWELTHVSKTWVIKTCKLVKNIDVSSANEKNLTEVFIDLENSDNFEDNSWAESSFAQ